MNSQKSPAMKKGENKKTCEREKKREVGGAKSDQCL